MSSNKLALIRYKTIDQCLKQRHRKWTLEDLMEKVSDALYELEGITSGVSKRTIQGDIQLMRSNKLGYNAPIVVKDRKFYAYDDPAYSISNSPLSHMDMEKMKEALDVLKHLNGFSFFEEMSDMIIRLEDKILVNESNKPNIVQMEGNKLLRGLEWINQIYQAIKNQIPLLIKYKSFKSQTATEQIYYPYLLKEYRNRWFLMTYTKNGNTLITLALDRILEIEEMAKSSFKAYEGIDFERYFSDTIGVTKSQKDRGQAVLLKFDAKNVPYVETKPLHDSQEIVQRYPDGSALFRIDVVLNLELEREILGFGECVEVLAPKQLKNYIKRRLFRAYKQYQKEPKVEKQNS
ncbi:helix-turn-helix transcriptional regulator [Sphingobacterium sp. 1.A.4]|uniref:helix-turn-helix transcriptional regulator n=1 Tax=Sphingobacterium sp. 1.A.4 TaxID=2044603 RepID=UPI000C0BE8D9|nr:WYL domain-containing protein [Sphingobacterium sp. 1.A.4]